MSKSEIIKLFKLFSIFIIATTAIGCVVIGLFSPIARVKSVMFAISVGITIGGIFKIKYAIPYKYKNKDERDLTISLISSIFSGTYFSIASFLAFIFVITGILSITVPESSYFIALAIIIGGTIIVERISYIILQRTY